MRVFPVSVIRAFAVVAALLALVAMPAPAAASPGDELPQVGGGLLDAECFTGPVPRPAAPTAPLAVPRATAAQSARTVRGAIRAAARARKISAEEAQRFEGVYRRALGARGRVSASRRVELNAVIGTVESLARARLLTASRIPVVLGQLARNVEWWVDRGAPPQPVPTRRPCTGGTGLGGARVRFDNDPTVYQWYPGQGLQIQPLGTFGEANAQARACVEPDQVRLACDPARFRAAADNIVRLAVDRGRFKAWEYYFAFGGGRPPWISGLSQATGMQALTRAYRYFGDRKYLDLARDALGAFRTAPPVGVRVNQGAGAHFLIYSYAPQLRVLNAFLQALVGIYDYAEAADDDTARRIFRAGDRQARREVPRHDTGAWSLYSTTTGAESDLGYHRLVRDFLRRLCERTKTPVYCETGERFHKYLFERARLRFLPSARPRARRAAPVRVFLSKLSCVTMKVTRGGRPVATVVRVLGRGAKTLEWVPPRAGEYAVEVEARDLLNHRTRITKTVKAAG